MRSSAKLALGMGLAVGIFMSASAARADEERAELAEKSGCTVCHKVNEKLVGPAYKDVAAKYRGNAKAPDLLFAKVKGGGAGVWGDVPMPPNVAVSDEDIKKLVAWVLSLK